MRVSRLPHLVFRRETPEQAVLAHRLRAARGTFDGTERGQAYIRSCTGQHVPTGTLILYTRDTGHHTSGWFKNPDFERCLHLSTSYCEPDTGGPLPQDRKLTVMWSKLFFGDDLKLAWIEPPATDHGKSMDVLHVRLFCDEHWRPIKPRGEVYSREFTRIGWRSASELAETEGRLIESPLVP